MALSAAGSDPLNSILDQMEGDEDFHFDPPECLIPQFTADDLPAKSSTLKAAADVESVSSHTSNNSHTESKTKYLFPTSNLVEPLRPEQVRWFYKANGKWVPFIGYDSLRLECKHREIVGRNKLSAQTVRIENDPEDSEEKICVRGSLYEVDVINRVCSPIYWYSENSVEVLRGTWFADYTWQPIKEEHADQIESEHLSRFENSKIDEKAEEKIPRKDHISMHRVNFYDAYVEWNTASQVFLYKQTTSSKLRTYFSKGGTKLRRGWSEEAGMEDKPPDICHLVFVTHGMGQKMEFGRIVRSCTELRDNCSKLRSKYFPNLDCENKRCEFLPCEWRRDLKLDGDIVETITPNKLRDVRKMLNESAMDIMYYTSPLYRSEITSCLQKELNRLYGLFVARHPYFEASGGKVSVLAHSLGSVIVYDIVTGWNPVQLYDQYVNNVIEECSVDDALGGVESCCKVKSSSIVGNQIYFSHSTPDLEELARKEEKGATLVTELEKARKRVAELEEELLKRASNTQKKSATLTFKLENFFLLGSPLAVFLALRGIRPSSIDVTKCTQDAILPKSLCNRIFNIFHPSDPVAYRLEPLLLKHYSSLKPLRIHRYNSSHKVDYDKIPPQAYNALEIKQETKEELIRDFTEALEDADVKIENGGDGGDDEDEESIYAKSVASEDDNKNENNKKQGSSWGWGWRRSKGSDATAGAELSEISPSKEKSASTQAVEQDGQEDWVSVEIQSQPEQTELEHRMDFMLKEGKMESAYLSALTSHTSYWTNLDVAHFLLTNIFPESCQPDASS